MVRGSWLLLFNGFILWRDTREGGKVELAIARRFVDETVVDISPIKFPYIKSGRATLFLSPFFFDNGLLENR